jgi:hypothetical protein
MDQKWRIPLLLAFIIMLFSFGYKPKGTSQRVASCDRIEVEEVKIDTCVYHVFSNAYSSSSGIFVIRIK